MSKPIQRRSLGVYDLVLSNGTRVRAEVFVNAHMLACQLAPRAIKSPSRRSKLGGGAILVEIVS